MKCSILFVWQKTTAIIKKNTSSAFPILHTYTHINMICWINFTLSYHHSLLFSLLMSNKNWHSVSRQSLTELLLFMLWHLEMSRDLIVLCDHGLLRVRLILKCCGGCTRDEWSHLRCWLLWGVCRCCRRPGQRGVRQHGFFLLCSLFCRWRHWSTFAFKRKSVTEYKHNALNLMMTSL